MPYLSIIVPVYNVENYLRECLDSVLNQSYKDYEVICVNDGSTDSSLQILEEYCKRNFRIKVISQKNQGLSIARNIGIESAIGEYICFLDSDDYFNGDMLSKVMEEVKKYDLNAYCYDVVTAYENNELKIREGKDNYYIKKNQYKGIKNGKKLFDEMMMQDDYCDSAWLFILKREFILEKNIIFYPGILYEDILFSLKIYMMAGDMMHIEQNLYTYRIRDNSIMTRQPTFENLRSYLISFKEVLSILRDVDDYDVQKAIVKYMGRMIDNVRRFDTVLDGSANKEFEHMSPKDQLLIEIFGIMGSTPKIDRDMYILGFKNLIQESHDIILYGAGKIGRMVCQYIEQIGLKKKIKCFAVSQEGIANELNQIPIVSISNLLKNKNSLVLITANASNQKEIQEKLEKMEFQNIKKIDYILERAIGERLEVRG